MMGTQYILGADGKRLYALVPVAEYEALLDAAEDRTDAQIYIASKNAPVIPGEMANRIFDGESPLRVWREHRGLDADDLAKRAGITEDQLLEIETGENDASLSVMASLARCLDLDVDDLVPANMDEEE